jgi:hypothetical protein
MRITSDEKKEAKF